MKGCFFWITARKLTKIPGARVMLLCSWGNWGLALMRKDGKRGRHR